MKYLYITDDSHWSSDEPPEYRDIESVIEGDLRVFRFNEVFEPVDYNDTDSWGRVVE